jgi:hypothetical protein
MNHQSPIDYINFSGKKSDDVNNNATSTSTDYVNVNNGLITSTTESTTGGKIKTTESSKPTKPSKLTS